MPEWFRSSRSTPGCFGSCFGFAQIPDAETAGVFADMATLGQQLEFRVLTAACDGRRPAVAHVHAPAVV